VNEKILQSARRFFAGTLLSRFSGLAREMTMAFCFGTSPAVGAFFLAYRLANLFRRLFGEGNLQSGFVPHFEGLYRTDPKSAFLFYRDVAFSLFFALTVVTLGVEGFLWLLSLYVSPGWREVAYLAMWMTPGLIFVCQCGLNSALLQCKKRYLLSSAAPVAFNFGWIVFAFVTKSVTVLAFGIVAAFGLQWLMTSWGVRQEIFRVLTRKEWFSPRLFGESWSRLARAMTLGIVGISAVQINSALDGIFARIADLAGPTYLWYAIRVQQLPLALFGIALSGALLPPLARAIQGGEREKGRELLRGALRQAAALMVPCAVGLFVLGRGGLSVLYLRGSFSEAALDQTLWSLWGYGVGLVPAVWVLLLVGGFYAKKSYGPPVIAAVTSVVCNVVLNSLFVMGMSLGAPSVALATGISSWVNAVMLMAMLKNEMRGVWDWSHLGKIAVCSLVAGLAASGVGKSFWIQAPVYAAGVLGMAR
jgi:putative peptidoglycan lipid II flippase